MSWIFIPEESTYPLMNSKRLREVAAHELLNTDSKGSNSIVLDDKSCLSLIRTGKGSILIAAWFGEESEHLNPPEHPLLAIWNDTHESTIVTLPEEELSFAIERVCLLAFRLWTNKPFPDSWTPKKISDHQSIFLSSRLQDVRVAYSLQ
jgi:hypothetical protein